MQIGDEVMDKDGRTYILIGVNGDHLEIHGEDGFHNVLISEVAKYRQDICERLAHLTGTIAKIQGDINALKQIREELFSVSQSLS